MRASITHCLDRGLPFALYRLPGGSVRLLVQEEVTPYPFIPGEPLPLKKGYLLAPFHPSPKEPAYMLSPDRLLAEDRPDQLPEGRGIGLGAGPSLNVQEEDRSSYMQKVQELVDRIREEKDLEKVVLSRSERVGAVDGVSIWTLFERLEALYPDAFVHLFHLPGRTTWIGASPELLLELEGEEGRTQALAGTRPVNSEGEWTEKERKEQKSVELFIASVLERQGIPVKERRGPETVKAGRIEHLSTRFTFPGSAVREDPSSFIGELHPTPAVCGIPRDRSLELIGSLESRPRSFYAGAIGPWGLEEVHKLFVNLRCARYGKDALELFVGGGINSDSDPGQEWEETVKKAGTMRRALG